MRVGRPRRAPPAAIVVDPRWASSSGHSARPSRSRRARSGRQRPGVPRAPSEINTGPGTAGARSEHWAEDDRCVACCAAGIDSAHTAQTGSGGGESPARLHQPPAMSPRAVPQRGGEAPWAGVGAWRLRLEPQGKCCRTCCADGLPRSRESRGGWTACGNGHAPGEPHWTSLSGVCLLLRGCARCVLAAGAEGASGVCGLPGVRRSRPARRAAGEPSLRSQRPCQGP